MDIPNQPIADGDALLRHVSARMFSERGAWARVARASAIAHGSVTRSEAIAHDPSPEFLADSAIRYLAEDGPGGRALFVDVIELAVERWIVGRGGATATAAWVAPSTVSHDTVTLPLPGSAGVVLLEALPATTLGRELGRAVPGAYGVALEVPLILPDDGDLSAALAFVPSDKPPASAETLARALGVRGGALQVLLGALTRTHGPEVAAALRARVIAGGDDADTLLVRAALARLGDRDAALAGLDFHALGPELLAPFDLVAHDDEDDHRVVVGPEVHTPLSWQP